uniref:Vasohibin n=1 Tax=Strigamia maritima TaxID=126957 RepID=T1IQU1_STRMM
MLVPMPVPAEVPRNIARNAVFMKDREGKRGNNFDDILFLVNRNGFPVENETWEMMWEFAMLQYPHKKDVINSIRYSEELKQQTSPVAPSMVNGNGNAVNPWDFTIAVQDYMEKLQYNHTGTQFFEIKKNKSMASLMETAKAMMRESLPIKCLESVVLGICLTNGLPNLERFPINFKTRFCERSYYHVVLGIYYGGVYGALGLSRRADLMYKPLVYKSLSDMVFDYVYCYKRYEHRVVKLTIGHYVPHNPKVNDSINWKGLCLHLNQMIEEQARKETDKYARVLRSGNMHGPIVLPPKGLISHLGRSVPQKAESYDDISAMAISSEYHRGVQCHGNYTRRGV